MLILLINYEYPPVGAGGGNATANIARVMVDLGHRPVVLTGTHGSLPAQSDVDGVRVIRVPAKRTRPDRASLFEMATFVASAACALPRVLRTEKPDAAIVFFSMPCGPLGLLARWWAGIPYVVSLRGGDVPGTEPRLRRVYPLLAPIRRAVLRNATAIVANSDSLKALSEATDPIPTEVIPNGVDIDYFQPPRERSERPFTFLFVGRFQFQKNLPFLLEAVSDLRRRTSIPFRVVMAGDGPLLGELQNRSAALGIGDVMEWPGWCDKKRLLAHYQQADCMLNPSLYEGMPNTVLEAMACGLPVVASDVVGTDALVVPNETGLLFSLAEAGNLSAAMHRVLGDPDFARRMGEAGRRSALSEFSWRNVGERYIGLLSATAAQPVLHGHEMTPRKL